MTARSSLNVLFAAVILVAVVASPSQAVPLLQVDFGSRLPNSQLQPGFQGMWGTNDHPTSATLGAYTVQLSASSSMTGTQSSRGFFTKLPGGRIDNTDASIRDFYRDFFFNRSTINGEGIDLQISGLTPNQPYNLTLTSFDADASLTVVTKQEWGPKAGSNTTGSSTTIDMLRDPVPTMLWDPLYSGTIQVSTTTGVLDIFGTTSAGSRGAVLNGFRLKDGTNDVLLVDLGEGAETDSIYPGFSHMSGPHFDADGPSDGGTQTFGAYTVSVDRVGGIFGDTGFYNEYAIRMGGEVLPPATHNLFRDCFANISVNNGEGIKLTIDGVTPNTEYDLTIWDMDPALPEGATTSTSTTWTPVNDTTGPTGNVVNDRVPVPQTIYDPNHLTTIRVKSTSTKLEIFGTTTSGPGGVRLNAIELNAVSVALPGDYNGNGVVDAADYVLWRDAPVSFGGDPAGYNTWRANFGTPLGSGADLGSGSVPEPAAFTLAFAAGLGMIVANRRRR